jgi:hypothetical protein
MSLVALLVVIGHIALHGLARETDESGAAHVWQLLMAAQIPLAAYFTIRWVPRAPRQALPVIVLQVAAALMALAPVYIFGL